MQKFDLVIAERGGRFIGIKDGKIAKVTARPIDRELTIHAPRVLPSFVDLHVHLRTPGLEHKEDLETGTRAAAAGGFTAVNAMANARPVISDIETCLKISRRAADLGHCDVYQAISATQNFDGKTTSHLDLPLPEQIRAVSDDGVCITDEETLKQVLKKCAEQGKVVMLHEQEEDYHTLRDLKIIEQTGASAHFCHVSTEVSARAIMDAQSRGTRVTWEVAPHHFALDDSTCFSVNPPLRPESDRLFILDCARLGLPDAIATDHAPHNAEDKQNGAPGMTGLETVFSVTNDFLRFDKQTLTKLLCDGPRKILGLPEIRIAEGFPADLVIVDDEPDTVNAAAHRSKSRNTPFDGKTYNGRVLYTIKQGVITYERQQTL